MRLQNIPSFYFTNSTAIDTITKKQGQIILSKDEQVLFIDVSASQRIRLDCVVHIENSSMLPLAPLDKIYVDDSTKDLYIYINDDWVKIPSQGHAEITVVKDDAEYDTHVIEAGNGIDVEEDQETGNVVLSLSLTDYYLEFTASDVDSGGILTINDARVGSFVILDNTGKLVVPAMTQVGTTVQVNFQTWTISGTWKVFFPLGAAASSESINSIVDTILSSNYVTSSASAPSLDIECGKVYQFTNALTSLTLTSVEHGHRATELRFTTGSNFTFTYETGSSGIVGIRGSEPTYTAGTTYHINIVDGFMEIKPVTVFAESEPSPTPTPSENSPFVEISGGNVGIATIGGCTFTKVNSGTAYAALMIHESPDGTFGRPVLISTSASAVVTDPLLEDTVETVTVNGVTWYGIGFEYAMPMSWEDAYVDDNPYGLKFVGNAAEDPETGEVDPIWHLDENYGGKADAIEHLVRIHLGLENASVQDPDVHEDEISEEYCPNCGEVYDGEHCYNCGYPDNSGEEHEEESRSCPSCGSDDVSEYGTGHYECNACPSIWMECPECHSQDITTNEDAELSYECNDCGHQWADDWGGDECPECHSRNIDETIDGHRCRLCNHAWQ